MLDPTKEPHHHWNRKQGPSVWVWHYRCTQQELYYTKTVLSYRGIGWPILDHQSRKWLAQNLSGWAQTMHLQVLQTSSCARLKGNTDSGKTWSLFFSRCYHKAIWNTMQLPWTQGRDPSVKSVGCSPDWCWIIAWCRADQAWEHMGKPLPHCN